MSSVRGEVFAMFIPVWPGKRERGAEKDGPWIASSLVEKFNTLAIG